MWAESSAFTSEARDYALFFTPLFEIQWAKLKGRLKIVLPIGQIHPL